MAIDRGGLGGVAHLGRPRGERKPEMTLRPVADRVAELLDREIAFGEEPGDLRMLENLRFDPREERNDPSLVAQLRNPSSPRACSLLLRLFRSL